MPATDTAAARRPDSGDPARRADATARRRFALCVCDADGAVLDAVDAIGPDDADGTRLGALLRAALVAGGFRVEETDSGQEPDHSDEDADE